MKTIDDLYAALVVMGNWLKVISGQLAAQKPNTVADWQKKNPDLSQRCRQAAEIMDVAYQQWLTDLTDEVIDQSPELMESEFTRREFIDKHGARLTQFATLVQNLNLLGTPQ